MNSLLWVLFVVGLTSAKTITYHNVTVSSDEGITDEDVLKNVTQSLYAFDQGMDQYIDWVSFDKMFQEMINHSGEYSVYSIGEIRRYFLKSRDYYFDAVASVYEWCSLIDILMTTYVDLYNDYTEGVEEQQRELILSSLEDGIKKMTTAVELLEKSRDHVNTGIVDLSNVMSNVSEAFRNDQRDHTARINDLNKNALNSLGQSFLGGIISLVMTEAVYKPEAEKKFEKIKSSFDFMKDKIMVSIDKTLEIKEKLSQEIVTISGLKGSVNANKLIFNKKYKFSSVKIAANGLKGKCNAYQERHIKKEN